MALPFSYRGQVNLLLTDGTPEIAADRFLDQLEVQLQNRKMTYLSRTASRLSFRCSVFHITSNWDLFAYVRAGEIEIEPRERQLIVRYHLRFSPTIIVVTGLLILLSVTIVYSTFDIPLTEKIEMLGVLGLLLFGMNFVLPILRFTSFLEACWKNRQSAKVP